MVIIPQYTCGPWEDGYREWYYGDRSGAICPATITMVVLQQLQTVSGSINPFVEINIFLTTGRLFWISLFNISIDHGAVRIFIKHHHTTGYWLISLPKKWCNAAIRCTTRFWACLRSSMTGYVCSYVRSLLSADGASTPGIWIPMLVVVNWIW